MVNSLSLVAAQAFLEPLVDDSAREIALTK
jgi:hypothetical protein